MNFSNLHSLVINSFLLKCTSLGSIWLTGSREKAKGRCKAGVTHLHAKEHLRWPANHQKFGRGKEGCFPAGFRGSIACGYLDFGPPASRSVGQNICIFCCSSPSKPAQILFLRPLVYVGHDSHPYATGGRPCTPWRRPAAGGPALFTGKKRSSCHRAAEATLVQKITIERGSLRASRASGTVKCLRSESEFRFLR